VLTTGFKARPPILTYNSGDPSDHRMSRFLRGKSRSLEDKCKHVTLAMTKFIRPFIDEKRVGRVSAKQLMKFDVQ
jgi:hypothetical protein